MFARSRFIELIPMARKTMTCAIAGELIGLTSVSNQYSKTAKGETLKRLDTRADVEQQNVRTLAGQITAENVPFIVNAVLQPKRLNDLQALILRQSWSGKTYGEIATASGYSTQHIRDVGYRLWQLLSNILGEKVRKSNVQSVLGQLPLAQEKLKIPKGIPTPLEKPNVQLPLTAFFLLPDAVVSNPETVAKNERTSPLSVVNGQRLTSDR
jgi:hypothetical protein